MRRLALALLVAGCQVSLPLDDGTREVSVEKALVRRLQLPEKVDLGAISFFPGLFDESTRRSTLWLRNTGTAPVTVHGVTVTSTSDALDEELCFGDGCIVEPITLPPGALARLPYRLRPISEGVKAFVVRFAPTRASS